MVGTVDGTLVSTVVGTMTISTTRVIEGTVDEHRVKEGALNLDGFVSAALQAYTAINSTSQLSRKRSNLEHIHPVTYRQEEYIKNCVKKEIAQQLAKDITESFPLAHLKAVQKTKLGQTNDDYGGIEKNLSFISSDKNGRISVGNYD